MDEAPLLTEEGEPAEPIGDATAILPTDEGTGVPAAKPDFSVDEWADLISSPGARQRIAEAPAAQRGAIVDTLLAKQEQRAKALAETAAADARQRGIEEGRNALARELVVQNIDSMEPFERTSFFSDPKNAGAEQLWHEAHANKATTAAAPQQAFVQQIIQQGQNQLQRLDGHAEYDAVRAEMTQGNYTADPAGLAALAARVERALASQKVARDDADATSGNRAAQILKSGPRTVRVGMGGTAPPPVTADSLRGMTSEEIGEIIKTPEGEKMVMAALRAG